jgi:hypothetical protein
VIAMSAGLLWLAAHNGDSKLIAPGPIDHMPIPCCNGSSFDSTAIDARLAVLLATREPAHVGGVSK